jgi:predicted phosphoadenosine phosphosulfate sulfurtransferase
MGNRTQAKVVEYVETWEKRCYKNGIPDDAPTELNDKVPSYKKICHALLNNDLNLTALGYSSKQSKFYSILKRIEIEARPSKVKQLKLNF